MGGVACGWCPWVHDGMGMGQVLTWGGLWRWMPGCVWDGSGMSRRGGVHHDWGWGTLLRTVLGYVRTRGSGSGSEFQSRLLGWDEASASRLLCQLDFRVWYLARGRGHVAGRDNEVVDSNGGDVCRQESRCGGG